MGTHPREAYEEFAELGGIEATDLGPGASRIMGETSALASVLQQLAEG